VGPLTWVALDLFGMTIDPIGLVVAMTGAFAAFTTWWLAKRGLSDREAQEKIANRIADDKVHLEETAQALDAYERVNAMHVREIQRLSEQNQAVVDLLKSERELNSKERKQHLVVVDRYRAATMELLQALLLAKELVSKESMTQTVIDDAVANATTMMKSPTAILDRRSTDPTEDEDPDFDSNSLRT